MAQRLLLPVRASTIAISLACALLLELLPWGDLRFMPDFVALVLVFWCVRQPRLVGLGVAWMLGLLIDAANGVLLGQHALAYSVLAFLGVTLSRRILWFGVLQQSLHVAAMLLFTEAIAVLIRLAAGAPFPGWAVFFGPLIAAALWPVVTVVLLLPQQRPVDADETRPI